MNSSLKPQPLIAEVLPGLTVLGVLVASYVSTHTQQVDQLLHLQSAVAALTGISVAGFFLAWMLGTFLDAVRNLSEWIWDRFSRIDWDFLFTGTGEDVRKLDDSFLAYYFLDGNYVAALCILLILWPSRLIHFPFLPFGIVCVALLLVFVGDAISLRKEVKGLIDRYGSRDALRVPSPPHAGVYARLAPSRIEGAGVGVVAITNIDKGTYLFEPDDEEMVWIGGDVVDKLPAELRRLYEDFAVLRGTRYGCPSSFNKLTVAWYLNSSKNPNVACNEDYRFYALRDIGKDEELTTDYDTYSDRPMPRGPH